jgi:hypothetical protein
MSKVIKLKQKDVENIVLNVMMESKLNEQNTETPVDNSSDTSAIELTVGMDELGNYYIFKNGGTPQAKLVAKVKNV